jgi:hypothetical protein
VGTRHAAGTEPRSFPGALEQPLIAAPKKTVMFDTGAQMHSFIAIPPLVTPSGASIEGIVR